jgi:threonine dehydratase
MGHNSTQSLVSTPSSTNIEWPEPIIPKPLGDTEVPGEPKIDYLKLILNSRVYDVASETPLTYANKVCNLSFTYVGYDSAQNASK